jgi:hypothetical protein
VSGRRLVRGRNRRREVRRRYEQQSHEVHTMKATDLHRREKIGRNYHRHCLHVESKDLATTPRLVCKSTTGGSCLDQPTTGGVVIDYFDEQEDALEQMYQHLKQELATAF